MYIKLKIYTKHVDCLDYFTDRDITNRYVLEIVHLEVYDDLEFVVNLFWQRLYEENCKRRKNIEKETELMKDRLTL